MAEYKPKNKKHAHTKAAEEIKDKYFEYERKIDDYRNECKEEFFSMFSKNFWMLWD